MLLLCVHSIAKIIDEYSDDTIGFRCASSTSEPAPTQATAQPTEMASTWLRPADGMIMAYIPAGIVTIGSDRDYEFAMPANSVSLEAFYIDQTEVTNSMYSTCVVAGICKAPSDYSSNSIMDFFDNPQYAKFPVSQVTWKDAKTYCEWAEARLPTEAEWEKAARGGVNSKVYPWGDEAPVCTPGEKNGAQFSACNNANTAPVASFGMNGYGIYDMTGNVWEWTSSLYKPYPYSATDGREDLNASGIRVLRGGSSCDPEISVAYRFFDADPDNWHYCIGFRCARSAQP
jgi:formylglycine-generating enzyme required for sulfatase activity